MKHDLKTVSSNFKIYGDFISAAPYGSGHINDTYAVVMNQGGTPVRYIFQRINHNIFKNPPALMENIQRVTEHISAKIGYCVDASRKTLTLIPTNDNNPFFQDTEWNYWRCYIFIEKAKTYDVIQTPEQAFQAAKAFGEFQRNLVDIKGKRLNETIPNFHNTVWRFENLEKAISADSANRATTVKKEIKFALNRKEIAGKLINLNKDGKIPERITHNDTKLNNVMIDDATSQGICVIDLDTVMPGLALYDFGDLVRTSTSPATEDEKDLSKVFLQLHMFEALVKGYLASSKDFLIKDEIANLAFSGKLITYEIGLRFLTDYLSGDIYFKIKRPEHNIDRCRTQFKLVESMETLEKEMNSIVEKAMN